MSYFDFVDLINKDDINVIFELGSRDLLDAIKLINYYKCKVYSFECNPDCLIECNKQLTNLDTDTKEKLFLINKAVSLLDGDISFYPFELTKYNNMGCSSMLKIDFTQRHRDDPDYNRENPQNEIIVSGTRLDTFIVENNINSLCVDLLCIDLQGYELNAIKSLGNLLHNVKYIITECSIESTYIEGSNFTDLNNYLMTYNFKYVLSNKFGYNFPDLTLKGYTEFDALFIRNT